MDISVDFYMEKWLFNNGLMESLVMSLMWQQKSWWKTTFNAYD